MPPAQTQRRPLLDVHSADALDSLISRGLAEGAGGASKAALALGVSMRLQAPLDMLRQVAMLRIYLAMSVFLIGYGLINSQPHALVPLLGLCVLSLVAILDVVINDWLPEQFYFLTAFEYRHWIYALQAIGLFSVAAVFAKRGDSVDIRLLLDAMIAIGIAFNDLIARHRK